MDRQERFKQKARKRNYRSVHKKEQSKKGKILFAVIFSTVILVLLFNFFIVFNVRQAQTVYEADLTITEPLAEGFTTPNFSANKGDIMKVYITNFYSNEGYSLVLILQGVGVEWQRVATEDTQFRHSFKETANYNIELAINNFDPLEGAEIKLHIKIMLT